MFQVLFILEKVAQQNMVKECDKCNYPINYDHHIAFQVELLIEKKSPCGGGSRLSSI